MLSRRSPNAACCCLWCAYAHRGTLSLGILGPLTLEPCNCWAPEKRRLFRALSSLSISGHDAMRPNAIRILFIKATQAQSPPS